MRVVTARVHDADFLAVIGGAHFGSERHVDLFRNRQRVHVRAQRDHRTGAATPEQTHHAGVRDAGRHLDAEGAQVLRDEFSGPRLPVRQLRMRMDVTTPRDHLVDDLRDAPIDIGVETTRLGVQRGDGRKRGQGHRGYSNESSHESKLARIQVPRRRYPRSTGPGAPG